MADSIPGNTTSTKTLEIDTSDTSSIDFLGDTDWWKVNLVYGFRYQVWINGYFEGQGTLLNPYLAVYSGAGVYSFANDNADSLSFYSYAYVTPSSTGYLFLSAEESGHNATGSYTIIIWQDELASTASAATIAFNSVSSVGHIGWQGDTSDWYKVTLTAGVQYQFDLIGSAADGTAAGLTLADPWLYLRNSSGASLIYDNDSGLGLNARIFYTPSTSGTYYLDAQALSSYSYGTYRLIINAAPTTAVLNLGIAQTGSIDFSGNVNLYSVTLAAGVAYGFSVDGSTLVDPYLELLDAPGTVINFDDDSGSGLGAYLSYTPTVSGTYYLAARESGNNATGTYSARVWQLPTVSIANATVTEGNSGSTNMVFTLSLSAASPVEMTVTVSTSGTSTATSGIDFQATTANLTIAAGQTNGTFLVPVFGDSAFEPTEVFYATLSSVAGAVAGQSTAFGRIVDNDSPYTSLPTDSFLKYQWHLYDSTGINVFPVWSSYTGRGVRVAVYDWGVDATNPDLSKNVLTSLGRKASDLSIGGAPTLTSDNHGTAVAGVIAAASDNYENVGVAFNSEIVSIYNTGAFSEIANAFTYAKNFDILNNSWGTGSNFLSGTNWAFVDDFSKPALSAAAAALKALADSGRGGLGTVVVQSAGNAFEYGDDTNLHNFQNSRYIITVGATDYSGSSASYSSPGSSILVSAPGGDGSDQYQKILTSDRTGADGYSTNDYTFIKGTSFASPIVAGVVALILEANPGLGYRDIQEILAYSARSTDTANNTWKYNSATDWNGGGLHYDAIQHDLGFGLVDALAAVRLAETWGGAKNSANVLEFSYSHSPNVVIPDYKASTGVGSVYDYISVLDDIRIERVEVSLKVTHTWIGDLYVLLTSPTGTTSYLISRPGSGSLSAYGSSQQNINFTLGKL
jgi:subtilisin family serine protease